MENSPSTVLLRLRRKRYSAEVFDHYIINSKNPGTVLYVSQVVTVVFGLIY